MHSPPTSPMPKESNSTSGRPKSGSGSPERTAITPKNATYPEPQAKFSRNSLNLDFFAFFRFFFFEPMIKFPSSINHRRRSHRSYSRSCCPLRHFLHCCNCCILRSLLLFLPSLIETRARGLLRLCLQL